MRDVIFVAVFAVLMASMVFAANVVRARKKKRLTTAVSSASEHTFSVQEVRTTTAIVPPRQNFDSARRSEASRFGESGACPRCHGKGTSGGTRCPACDGSGLETLKVDIRCPRCGRTGKASFSRRHDEKGTYWHIVSVSDEFNHDEHSLGGAEIWCPCHGVLVCDPNGTGRRSGDSD
jgi:rubredoxin